MCIYLHAHTQLFMAMHYDVKERSLLYKDIDNCFVYKKKHKNIRKNLKIFEQKTTRYSKEITCMFSCTYLLLPIVFVINLCKYNFHENDVDED